MVKMTEFYLFKSIVSVLVIFFVTGCNSSSDTITPTVCDITESVYASVTITPDSLYKVHTTVSGILIERYVQEGDMVREGQVLVQISNESPHLNTENARLALQLARENLFGSSSILKTLENKIETARLTWEQDSLDYLRQHRLHAQDIGTRREYEIRKMNFERSTEALQSLQKEYNRTKVELGTALNTAQNNYQNALLGKEDFAVKSRMSGKVYAISKEAGELVSPQEPIATIGKSDSFTIHLLVDEVDITKIRLDQRVIIGMDAFEGRVFEARISRILPQKDTRTQTFTVEAKFTNPPDHLYSGLSGEGNIIINQKQNILVIPRSYLTPGNQVKTSDEMIDVEVGLMNMEYVEIVSGLDSTTQLFLPE
ncbi:MAG: efflux RND transporter periplasmic adaptor subunit [Cyclobacteriaceae bacterium]